MVNNNDASIYRVGDIVIGSKDPSKSIYSATGTKIVQEGVSLYGSEQELADIAKDLTRSAMGAGGIPLPVLGSQQQNQPKGKKRTSKSSKGAKNPSADFGKTGTAQYIPSLYTEIGQYTQPIKEAMQLTVQFENDFGKIKAKVENIVEHDLAFLLIFTNEDSVVFEPKVGEQLALHTPDRERFEVYYPGVTFDSPENTKKFMILFKVPEEN
jgi:hypothetical protein